MATRDPGEGRYAHLEREQRWLVDAVPRTATRAAAIADLYIIGTRLRLRRSETETVFKLGQKVRVQATGPELVKLTNIYLSAVEYATAAQLSSL